MTSQQGVAGDRWGGRVKGAAGSDSELVPRGVRQDGWAQCSLIIIDNQPHSPSQPGHASHTSLTRNAITLYRTNNTYTFICEFSLKTSWKNQTYWKSSRKYIHVEVTENRHRPAAIEKPVLHPSQQTNTYNTWVPSKTPENPACLVLLKGYTEQHISGRCWSGRASWGYKREHPQTSISISIFVFLTDWNFIEAIVISFLIIF